MNLRRSLLSLGFGILILLLASCQSLAGESGPTPVSQSGPIVPSLPSISELAGTPAPEIPPLPAFGPEEIALGQEVYDENCAECHGKNLEGEANWQMQNEDNSFRSPPHDANGHTWHHGDSTLIESIVLGGDRLPDNIGGFSQMPAYGTTLTFEEIAAVLTYINST